MENQIKNLLEEKRKKEEILKAIEEILLSEEFKKTFFLEEKISDVVNPPSIVNVFKINLITDKEREDYTAFKHDLEVYLYEKLGQIYPDEKINLAVFLNHPKEKEKFPVIYT